MLDNPNNPNNHDNTRHGLKIVCGNHKYLGGMVGVDDAAATEWLTSKLSVLTPVIRAVRDPHFPAALAAG